ncbi:hypothetical protein [Actinotalea subterranea]|uniref:hypothetical protein n=1 Tax=Actinotalea subterranea TaxID=2607497 RepID=UPI001FEB63C2|nr:hypothetical protein [Actinotalea subterranea]
MTGGPPEAADQPPGQAAPASGFAAPPQDGGPTPDDGPAAEHTAPDGVSQATVDAVGKLTAALELVEQARGMLYGFHRLTGHADNDLLEAVEALATAGHSELADRLREDLLGRNVVSGRWTFQVVEDYDDSYWQPFRDWERTVRAELLGGRRHVYEAQLKEERRTHGRPGHEARPPSGS